MKRPSFTTNYADLLIVMVVTVLFIGSPVSPYRTKPTGIPDKVEIRYAKTLSTDSLQQALQYVEDEILEMDYYLRVHNVDDEGYNMVADYNTELRKEYKRLKQQYSKQGKKTAAQYVRIAAKDRQHIAVMHAGGYWQDGLFHVGPFFGGKAIARDSQGRIVSGIWDHDTIVKAIRIDRQGIYQGHMDRQLRACGQGVMDEWDGCHKEGFWFEDVQHGFGFDSSPQHHLRIGEWKNGKFLGERMRYTAQRIYGIDISRHQHEKGRRRYAIHWNRLRITSFGKRHDIHGQTFPVSFVYIKASEGVTIHNRYFRSDYRQARKHGMKVGAYHFFSLQTPARKQALHFLRTAIIRQDDLPPVLDVEPSEAMIKSVGEQELLRRVRLWLETVEQQTGRRPILYISQSFVNKHLKDATDIKQKYKVWIARYGQYKPDVKLSYWQLCADGRVDGITGPVDINVFNGYQGQYQEFLKGVR